VFFFFLYGARTRTADDRLLVRQARAHPRPIVNLRLQRTSLNRGRTLNKVIRPPLTILQSSPPPHYLRRRPLLSFVSALSSPPSVIVVRLPRSASSHGRRLPSSSSSGSLVRLLIRPSPLLSYVTRFARLPSSGYSFGRRPYCRTSLGSLGFPRSAPHSAVALSVVRLYCAPSAPLSSPPSCLSWYPCR